MRVCRTSELWSGFGYGRGYSGNHNRGAHAYWNPNRLVCQICTRFGHVAVDCYHRFDASCPAPSQNQASSSAPVAQRPNNGANLASRGHMTAMLATPELVRDPNWYPDSGASNHVTANEDNLMTMA